MFSSNLKLLQANQKPKLTHPIIVIGNGPVGMRAAGLILDKDPNTQVIIFGEESSQPYNRVQLSLFLAGSITKNQLSNSVLDRAGQRFTQYIGQSIIHIDRLKKIITCKSGESFNYSKLILSLGSSPVTPDINNTNLQNIFQFRTINDATALLEKKQTSHNVFVVGSGPLGLETAVAMKQPNNKVFLQVREKLLSHEVDENAQLVLADYLGASGIKQIIKNPVINIVGGNKVKAVELANGETIACDCLVFCSGIQPNILLAKSAGIDTRKGIVVNRYGLTSDKNIYAIGECCEFENKTYGVVSPGYTQAFNCVNHALGYAEKRPIEALHIQVKFNDYTTAFFGELCNPKLQDYRYINRLKGVYRKLVVDNKRLVGAIIIGNWAEQNEIKKAVDQKLKISNKELVKFENTGLLFKTVRKENVKELPKDYLICLCESVSRGELSEAITAGCRTVETLGQRTKAGITCGSCKPLLANLLDQPAPNLVMRHQQAIFWTSLFSIFLILLTILFEPLSINQTVQINWHIEKIWFDNFWKQVSGYSLLGLCILAAALGLRKRFKKISFGHLDLWRYIHSIIGIVALFVLMIHTGVRMGSNLNFALMSVFLAATTTGSLVGIFMAKNHHWSDIKLAKHRLWWSRIHYTLLWMLPPLLSFHILSAYYF